MSKRKDQFEEDLFLEFDEDMEPNRNKPRVPEIGMDFTTQRYMSVTPGQPQTSLDEFGVLRYEDDTYEYKVKGTTTEEVFYQICEDLGVNPDTLPSFKIEEFAESFYSEAAEDRSDYHSVGYDALRKGKLASVGKESQDIDDADDLADIIPGQESLKMEDLDIADDEEYNFTVQLTSPNQVFEHVVDMLGINKKYITQSRKKAFMESLNFYEAGDVVRPFNSVVNESLSNVVYNAERFRKNALTGISNFGRRVAGNVSGFSDIATLKWSDPDFKKYEYFDQWDNRVIKSDYIIHALGKVNEGTAAIEFKRALDEFREANPYSINKEAGPFISVCVKLQLDVLHKVIDIYREPQALPFKLHKPAFGPRVKVQDYIDAAGLLGGAWQEAALAAGLSTKFARYGTEVNATLKIIEKLAWDRTPYGTPEYYPQFNPSRLSSPAYTEKIDAGVPPNESLVKAAVAPTPSIGKKVLDQMSKIRFRNKASTKSNNDIQPEFGAEAIRELLKYTKATRAKQRGEDMYAAMHTPKVTIKAKTSSNDNWTDDQLRDEILKKMNISDYAYPEAKAELINAHRIVLDAAYANAKQVALDLAKKRQQSRRKAN